jgi:2-aminoethylphosphonate-pyruvate transaminase
MPTNPNFNFQFFYDQLKDKGFIIYPGKLTVSPSFRIGCIGNLGADEMEGVLVAVKETIIKMGIAIGTIRTA